MSCIDKNRKLCSGVDDAVYFESRPMESFKFDPMSCIDKGRKLCSGVDDAVESAMGRSKKLILDARLCDTALVITNMSNVSGRRNSQGCPSINERSELI